RFQYAGIHSVLIDILDGFADTLCRFQVAAVLAGTFEPGARPQLESIHIGDLGLLLLLMSGVLRVDALSAQRVRLSGEFTCHCEADRWVGAQADLDLLRAGFVPIEPTFAGCAHARVEAIA